MQLNAAILNDLVRSLRSNPATGVDKRRRPRVGVRLKANMQFTRQGQTVTAPIGVRDLSGGGIGFSCHETLERGERILLILAGDTAQTVSCEVSHCRRVASGVFQVGAKFVDAIPAVPSVVR